MTEVFSTIAEYVATTSGSHSIASAATDTSVSLIELRPGVAGREPLLLLGSEAAWGGLWQQLAGRLSSALPVACIALSGESVVRTSHGAAVRLLEAARSAYPGLALSVLAFEPAGRVAHAFAIQCLMQDVPLGFVGVIDAACVPEHPSAVEHCRLAQLSTAARDEECLGLHFDLHWFARQGCAPDSLPLDRLQAWPVGANETNVLASRIAKVLAAVQGVPTTAGEHEPLVTIQSGRRGADPYFCLPGAGASVIDFIPFSAVIGDAHPVYGLQSRGMCGEQLPAGCVESAARRYVAVIEAQHPSGVIHLVGHSFGGWLAFEVATRLHASGREVGSLTLLDSDAPGLSTRVGHEYTRPEALMQLVSIYEQAAGRSMGLDHGAFESLSCEDQLCLLHQKLVAVGLLPRASSSTQLRGAVRSFEAAVRTRYRPVARFEGPTRLVLVRGKSETVEAAVMRQYAIAEAWRRLAPKLTLRREAGNHVTLLKMPHIGETVRWLKSDTITTQNETSLALRAASLTRTH